jgi:NADH-ubiquinone oxidoreductase chain 6
MLYLLLYDNSSEFFVNLTSTLEILFLVPGLLVIISKNPIVSILFLIALFLLVSIYLILLGINFIGISYLLVYIGAVSILFLFILMLIDIRISELHIETMNNVILAIVLGIFLYIPLLFINISNFNLLYVYNKILNATNKNVNYIFHNTWEGSIVENIDITAVGNILYTNISLWLILSLLILLLAMVGAIVINLDVKPN